MAAPFKEVEFDIAYGTGVNRAGEIIDLGAEAGLIEKSGSFYSWNGQRLGQGRDKAAAHVAERPEIVTSIREALLAAARTTGGAGAGGGLAMAAAA
jgi:recombination protein RecA